eukprot:gene2047-1235_t
MTCLYNTEENSSLFHHHAFLALQKKDLCVSRGQCEAAVYNFLFPFPSFFPLDCGFFYFCLVTLLSC